MKRATDIFHAISCLQYPLMLVAFVFVLQPYFNGFENYFSSVNRAMIFIGLGISFSSLQDTKKTQNKLSLRIYQNPAYARIFIISVFLFILFFLQRE